MKIIWTPTARMRWTKTVDYINDKFGINAVDTFLKRTDETLNLLSAMPSCGSIESLLSDRNRSYRSIVFNKLSKLIYTIDNDTIIVVDYWDTRREPSLLIDKNTL